MSTEKIKDELYSSSLQESGEATEEIKDELYTSLTKRQWKKVVEIYEKHPELHASMITKYGDTAMHVAITHGVEDEVLQLFDEVAKIASTAEQTLKARNELGDTPLHCATRRGFLQICKRILREDEELLFEPNRDGETPLFLAALNGHKEAFLYLHSICVSIWPARAATELRTPWKRADGDTILHVTIEREYFDLAFLIIHLYDGSIMLQRQSNNSGRIYENEKRHPLASYKNAEGITPLHVLANKPSAFKSVTRLNWWHGLIYLCLPTTTLEAPSGNFFIIDVGKMEQSTDTKKQAENCCTCFAWLERINKIKQKHIWCSQILRPLLEHYDYKFIEGGSRPSMELTEDQKQLESMKDKIEGKNGDQKSQEGQTLPKGSMNYTPFLLAASNGLLEFMNMILDKIPMAIHDKTTENKNAVLVAVEKRQPVILMELKSKYKDAWDRLIEEVDEKGNNALHLAAKLSKYKPWEISGSAMQMQWEIKFYQFVQTIVPQHLNFQTNKKGQTPQEMFAENHKDLVKESGQWLKDTSESCSIVAVLVAGITFAACIQVPGGSDDKSGLPVLNGKPEFNAFAESTLIALCTSLISLVMFLAILTSRKQPTDFLNSLPLMLLLGLSSMFVSITSILVSFCSAYFFVLEHRSRREDLSIYTAAAFPVALYAMTQLPLYFDVLKAIYTRVPQPSYVGNGLYTM